MLRIDNSWESAENSISALKVNDFNQIPVYAIGGGKVN